MAKGKRRRVDLDHYSARDKTPVPLLETIERHTQIQPGRSRLSTRQQYISVPTSPVRSRSTLQLHDEEPVFRTEFYDDTTAGTLADFDNETMLDEILVEDGRQLSGMEILERTADSVVASSRKRSLASVSILFSI